MLTLWQVKSRNVFSDIGSGLKSMVSSTLKLEQSIVKALNAEYLINSLNRIWSERRPFVWTFNHTSQNIMKSMCNLKTASVCVSVSLFFRLVAKSKALASWHLMLERSCLLRSSKILPKQHQVLIGWKLLLWMEIKWFENGFDPHF